MKHDVMRGLMRTVMDGLKDTQMQYEYAEEAMEEGEPAIAKALIEEAQKRLTGTQEWWKHADTMAGGDQMYHMAMEYYHEWCHKLKAEIEAFMKDLK